MSYDTDLETNNIPPIKLDEDRYYAEALKWYHKKYISVLWELNYLFYILCIAFFIIFLLYLSLKKFMPIAEKVPFKIYRSYENTDDQTKLIKLKSDNTKIGVQNAIARYLIENYVTQRENYSINNLENQENYIRNNSSYQVFKEFIDQMNIQNRDSPIIKYKQNTVKTNILNIEIKNLNSINSSALLDIKKSISNNQDHWDTIYVQYQLSDINLAYKNNVPLEFLVINYEVLS
ncbi:hypothetical protein GUI12_03335 [Anaplasmataceae bacterium AB001_6]|nr:hypothetical protein GUI12_03335 [Anaplasmataceae bacterium AB001_6]